MPTVDNRKFIKDKLRIREAAELFSMSESWFRHAISRREIPAYKLSGALFVSRSEIDSLIESGKIS